MIRKLSRKFSLTGQETAALLIMLGFVLGGMLLSGFKERGDSTSFDYSGEEELFRQLAEGDYPQNNKEIIGGDIDSLSVVSEFNKDNLKKNKTEKLVSGQKININTADLEELCRLPGIGEKTAQKIIRLRSRLGSFSSVNQLLSVQGIGEKKLEQIKPYLSF